MQVRLFFDDYMEGDANLTTIQVATWQLPDSLIVGTTRVLTSRAFQTLRNDTARATSPRLPPADSTNVLPINELVWIPQRGLVPNTRYRITVTGFTNLHGLQGGGGSVVVTSPPPARTTPAAPRDSTARRDSTFLR